MQSDVLSIKEFAAAAGVSQQSIYKRLKNNTDELYPFLQIIEGKKYISIIALSVIYNVNNQEKKEAAAEQPQTADNSGKDEIISLLKSQIEAQQREIDTKNNLINDLMLQVEKAQQLVNQEQQLHLLDRKRILELEERFAEPEPEEPPKEEKKKGFFSLFRKKGKEQ